MISPAAMRFTTASGSLNILLEVSSSICACKFVSLGYAFQNLDVPQALFKSTGELVSLRTKKMPGRQERSNSEQCCFNATLLFAWPIAPNRDNNTSKDSCKSLFEATPPSRLRNPAAVLLPQEYSVLQLPPILLGAIFIVYIYVRPLLMSSATR